jgi:CHAD domain
VTQARDGGGPKRAYRLRPGKRPAKEAVRIAQGRIDDAIERLRDHGREPAEAVHEARKDLKKLRSLLRLARPVLGGELYRRENARFRNLGRSLSATRDAEVNLQTLAALRDGGLVSDGVDDYGSRSPASAPGPRRPRTPLRGRSRRAPTERSTNGTSSAGSPPARGCGESTGAGARRSPPSAWSPPRRPCTSGESGAKDLWYHLRLLRARRPEVLEPAVDEAH